MANTRNANSNLRASGSFMDGFGGKALVTLFVITLATAFLLPFAYMFMNSMKTQEQIADPAGDILPMSAVTISRESEDARLLNVYEVLMPPDGSDMRELALFDSANVGVNVFIDIETGEEVLWNADEVEGVTSYRDLERVLNADGERLKFEYREVEELPLYDLPMPDGSTRRLALVQAKRNGASEFLDYVTDETIEWDPADVEGFESVRQLEPIKEIDFHPENYVEVLDALAFGRLFFNTVIIAGLGIIGTVLSCSAVAYGFTRFPIPFKNVLFLLLISTIILPSQVTLIPKYFLFKQLGWVGTWLPLIVPHFFANAYNVFLLRQYFLTIPKDLDEAAYMDGATPIQVLFRIIIPQSMPAMVAVSLFHLIFAWNDYFEPLIYIGGKEELAPLALGFGQFTFKYASRPELLMSASFLALGVPVLLFFLAQRYFMQGVVFTGVK